MTTRRILADVALGLLCLSACWPLVELSKAGSVGVPIVVAALVVGLVRPDDPDDTPVEQRSGPGAPA